jgi:L-seryl-tRNA(Ser) seleniumtransferase
VISRGELVEIGGGFRVPEVLEASGASLVEVGTTNRTRLDDYRGALAAEADVAVVLKVHQSNYRITGFTASVDVADLATLGVPLVYDIGSGLLDAGTPWLPGPPPAWLASEPAARQSLEAGADVVTFSADKLFGGPQAGVIAGRADLVERCRRHPIARAVRPDKLTLAAMEVTLWAHARGDRVTQPVWRMLNTSVEEIAERSRAITSSLPSAEVLEGVSVTGGGSMPGRTVDTTLIVINVEHPVKLLTTLRHHDPPVIARIERGSVVLDLRTVDPADDAHVEEALRSGL